VRLIDDAGEQVGIVATRDALTLAQERGLDLVEVSPTARPPVCRIMDYGKFKYEQSKRDRSARKKQHVVHLKEVKLRPKIEDHDYFTKLQHARTFLEEKNKVKFTVTFRGREIAHPEIGHKLLVRVLGDLADLASAESNPRSEGRMLTVTLLPKPGKPPVKEGPAKAPAAAKEPAKPAPKGAPRAEVTAGKAGPVTG
jgi:translation initiation factor IF-3